MQPIVLSTNTNNTKFSSTTEDFLNQYNVTLSDESKNLMDTEDFTAMEKTTIFYHLDTDSFSERCSDYNSVQCSLADLVYSNIGDLKTSLKEIAETIEEAQSEEE